MKKLLSMLVIVVATLTNSFAQVPLNFNYQGVARDNQGVAIANQPISVQLSLLQGNANGPVLYTETHSPTTDGVGLFTLQVGSGTSPVPFATINWALGSFYLKIDADLTGGSNYQFLGTLQIVSVPYAIIAQNVAPNYLILYPDFVENGITGFVNDTIRFKNITGIEWIDGSPEQIITRVDSVSLNNTTVAFTDSTVLPYTTNNSFSYNVILNMTTPTSALSSDVPYNVSLSHHSATGKVRYSNMKILVKQFIHAQIAVKKIRLNCTDTLDNDTTYYTASAGGFTSATTFSMTNMLGHNEQIEVNLLSSCYQHNYDNISKVYFSNYTDSNFTLLNGYFTRQLYSENSSALGLELGGFGTETMQSGNTCDYQLSINQ